MLCFNVSECIIHGAVECLIAALDARDSISAGHSKRVADMSYDLSYEIGLRGEKLELVHLAAHLHDIGKIGIPDRILLKKGKLEAFEYFQVKRHPEIGYEILNKSKKLKNIAKIVLHHHERWDGRGYPCGLKGEDIPLESRIIAICDAIDAMLSNRPYRKAIDYNKCLFEIESNQYKQFDPQLVEPAKKLLAKWFYEIYNKKNNQKKLIRKASCFR